ncbi:MAG: hypothetical protein ACXVZU_01145 [Methanobacteriaceae archaeon]
MTETNSDNSLSQVFAEVESWRSKKTTRSEKMPDMLWKKIIEIYKTYPEQAQLCQRLGVTKKQLKTKLQEFGDEHFYSDPVKLCEIPKISSVTEPKLTVAKLNTEFSSLATIVVEFCRSDGCIMKIHTTTKSINELITSFLGGNYVAANS